MRRSGLRHAMGWLGGTLLALAGCGPHGGGREGHWTSVDTTHNQRPMHIEYRDDLGADLLKDKPALLTVSWHFVDAQPDGLPMPAQRQSFEAFERPLIAALGKDGTAVLAATISVDHQHDWYFYAKAGEAAEVRANERIRNSTMQSMLVVQSEPQSAASFKASLDKRVRH